MPGVTRLSDRRSSNFPRGLDLVDVPMDGLLRYERARGGSPDGRWRVKPSPQSGGPVPCGEGPRHVVVPGVSWARPRAVKGRRSDVLAGDAVDSASLDASTVRLQQVSWGRTFRALPYMSVGASSIH